MNINNHKHRVLLAEETLKICEAGQYTNTKNEIVPIREQLDFCLEHTLHYTPERLQQIPAITASNHTTRIEVTGETTLGASERLVVEKRQPVLALNFASAKNPGGGFLGGSVAQEENIARSSALYPSLLKAPEYYSVHRNSDDLLYTDHMIYSPQVPVFRNDDGALLDTPYLLSIITSPAANKGAIINNNKPGIERIEEVMLLRAEKVLKIAVKHQYKNLILGAWGCGVFRNDPKLIAEIFRRQLTSPAFRNAFEHIVFAVYDRTKDQSVFNAFRETFAEL